MSNELLPRAAGFGVAAAAVALLAACGGGTPANSPSSGQAPASGTSGAAGPSAGNTVTVTMTEFKLDLPSSFTPGTYTFVATNAGHTVHALEIDGPGVQDQKTPDVQPGQSAKLTVSLQDGAYDFYCPVDDHRAEGMDTKVNVSGAAGVTTTTAGNGSNSGGSNGYY